MSKFDLLWSKRQREDAAAEGWQLALVVNDGKPVHSAYFDIFDAGPRFKGRHAAIKHVLEQARNRSKLHMDAMAACAASKLDAAHHSTTKTQARPRR